MKIAFVGKGGSGKSTASALFAKFLASRNRNPLIIDADINQHLAFLLGFPADHSHKRALGHHASFVKTFFRGRNTRFLPNEMIKTTPPGNGSRLITTKENNELYTQFCSEKDGIQFISIGDTAEDDIGIRCYHSKTGSLELFLNHTVTTSEDYLLVDMTAGADAFASGLFAAFDCTCLVVEPTFQSCAVWKQYKERSQSYDVHIVALGNKITCPEDIAFIEEQIGQPLLGHIPVSSHIKKYEQGRSFALTELDTEILQSLERLHTHLATHTPDRAKRYELAVHFHTKNALSWGNQQVGKDLTTQIDPEFDIEESALKLLQQS